MEDAPESKILSYTATTDPVAYERLTRRRRSSILRKWVEYYIQTCFIFWIISAVAFNVAALIIELNFTWRGMVAAGCCGALGGIIWFDIRSNASLKRSVANACKMRWEVRLMEDYCESTDNNGITWLVPWKIMEIKLDDPEAWVISFGEFERMVFRQPLRDAGLEEEFLRRLNAAHEPSA